MKEVKSDIKTMFLNERYEVKDLERLQKVIAQAGVTSRRKAEELIVDGKVSVNGEIVTTLGTKVNPQKDKVVVNGVPLEKEELVYYLLYKPTGVISSVDDEHDRKIVTDYVHTDKRIFPIGRLDYDTSGLLLLTNDGELANLLMHPKSRIYKTYIVKAQGVPENEALKKLERGIELEDGKTAPARVKLTRADRKKGTSIIEISIHEGRNRQVRRMFDAIGHPVLKLKRESYAFLNLKGMNAGDSRELKPYEVVQLKELVGI